MAALLVYIRSSVVGASVRLLTVVVALLLTFVLSLFLYGSLYYSYIPPSYYELPLHFVRCTSPGGATAPPPSQQQKEQTPNASVGGSDAVAAAAAHHLDGSGGSVPLVAELDALVGAGGGPPLPLFAPGHVYAVTVEFQLPESEGNVALGTFELRMRTYDRRGETLQAAERMLRLRYRSWLLRVLDTLVFAPLYLFGEREQKQTLDVELFDEYRENGYRPTARIVLELSDWRVELYAARLRVRVSFVGLRYWMFHWPLTSAVVGVASFESFLLVVLASSWLARLRRRRRAVAVPAGAQIASATNLPAVGAAESVSSLAAADVVPAVSVADDGSTAAEDCGPDEVGGGGTANSDGSAWCDDGDDVGKKRVGPATAAAAAWEDDTGGGSGSGSELRRRQQSSY